jgi:hypothetical protein
MASGSAKSVLWVESQHDKFVIIHLMKKHGVPWQKGAEPITIKHTDGDTAVLNAIQNEVDGAKGTGRSVGFVLDIDTAVGARWQQVVSKLKAVGLNPPDHPVANGYFEASTILKISVGVWLMPDNQLREGDLEDFLKTLLPATDNLYEFATKCSADSLGHGAKYPLKDKKKANMHCWLAWQEEPGTPYGQAIVRRYFESHSATANSFVAWFKHLFLQAPNGA